jgi:F5/8 type C domain-containing protein
MAAVLLAALILSASPVNTVRVDVTPTHAINAFDPLRAIGGGVDSQNNGAVQRIYTHGTIGAMLSSGLGPVSYRLYTELSVQHWHWNPQGSWSDPSGQGYWTGSTTPGPEIVDSYGYRLPHRGFTHDQANDDDYSRLTDGDPTSYWKSDPYLTRSFTHEDDALHPQWVVVDLGQRKPIDAIRLRWTDPYAVQYQVQYWRGADAINSPTYGTWVTFPKGGITTGSGGDVLLRLDGAPRSVEFLRVLMTLSSNTCDTHGSADVRDCVGYALAEIGAGTVDSTGAFYDLINHRPDNRQTTTYASSVDPWHAPVNRVTDQEQAGLDIVFDSGLTRGLPTMVSVSMLYGIPSDAAAEIAYLEARHDPISYVELGEEPDGQYILPEDYAALYVQWARAIHAVDPSLKLGGPVFQGVTQDVKAWADATGDTSWFHRFLKYLAAHGGVGQLQFMSFEHYPFDPCDPSIARDLLNEPQAMRGIMKTWIADGLPAGVPMFVTETNFSANSAEVMQDISGALWLADFEGSFLSNGGAGTFLYQYEPEPLVSSSGNCTSWGAWGMFAGDNLNHIKQPTSQYFAAQLVTRAWAQPVDATHVMFRARSDVTNHAGNEIVTAYALKRPDGQMSLMLVNKDPKSAYSVTVDFHDTSTNEDLHFSGTVSTAQFGPAQYVWHRAGAGGYANPDGPVLSGTAPGGPNAAYKLPAASITVLTAPIK